ncbi:MAG: hypothetical protein V4850_01255 [Myxococcota bacterium]
MTTPATPVLSYEDFFEQVEAHFAYAKTLPANAAVDLVERRLGDATWREAPAALVDLVCHLSDGSRLLPVAAGKLTEQVVVAFASLGRRFDEGIHDALRQLVPFLARTEARHVFLDPLVAWLTAHATPGEARLVAELLTLSGSHMGPGGVAPALRPLAIWLLDYGSAELRATDRRTLVARLLQLVVTGEPGHLPAALRVVLRRSDAEQCIAARIQEPLWRALEKALEAGCAPSLAVELANTVGESAGLAFVPGNSLPRVRQALVAGLLRAQISAPLDRAVWSWALATEPPANGSISHAPLVVLERALDVLPHRARASSDIERVGSLDVHVQRMRPRPEWVRALLDAWLDVHGGPLAAGEAGRRRLLSVASSHPNLVASILRERLSPQSELARLPIAILDSAADLPVGVEAAVRALPKHRQARAPAAVTLPDSFEALLRDLVNAPWVESAFGVDLPGLLGSARNVRFDDLSPDDKVRVSGDILLVDREYPSMLASETRWNSEERDALLVLYVVHELAHFHQGIGDKTSVQALREAGAESSLMHVDLAADHVAALLTAQVVRRWSLSWLKNLQGRSLADFPVGPTHPSGSRARKAARLVGVRVDWLVREHSLVSEARLGQGYAFAEYGPAGGKLLVLVSGPPNALILQRPLARAAAEVLVSAADEANVGPEGLRRVDSALRDALLGR